MRPLHVSLACAVAVSALFLGACEGSSPSGGAKAGAAAAPATSRVDGAQAHALVKAGAKLVDVRSADEFADKHVDGAVNVPVDTIDAADLGPKDGEIIVYCQSGGRSARAAKTLAGRGYTRVHDLGGMSNWDK